MQKILGLMYRDPYAQFPHTMKGARLADTSARATDQGAERERPPWLSACGSRETATACSPATDPQTRDVTQSL